jgi:hypothetical protein
MDSFLKQIPTVGHLRVWHHRTNRRSDRMLKPAFHPRHSLLLPRSPLSWHRTSVVPSSLEFSRLRRLFLGIDERFDDGCARRIKRRLNGATDLLRALAAEAIGAACLRKGYEVDGRQCASVFGISDCFLFEFYLSQAIILED